MIIAVNIENKMIGRIQEILEASGYESIQEFIRISVINQLELESSKNKPDKKVKVSTPEYKSKENEKEKIARQDNIDKDLVNRDADYSIIETFEMKSRSNYENIKDLWIWGQINRVIGIKIGTRTLINLQRLNNGGAIEVPLLLEGGTKAATYYGNVLLNEDISKGRKRGDKLSTSLPITIKGIDRYQKQFLFSERKKDGHYSSAIIDLGFANFNPESRVIAVTKAGMEFALLYSPIIDGDYEVAHETLSEDERNYYIEHVKKNIEQEWDAITWMLNHIGDNVVHPSLLDEELKKECKKWTDDMAVTQRAGALGRFMDLGIIGKHKDGVTATYYVTDFGKELI